MPLSRQSLKIDACIVHSVLYVTKPSDGRLGNPSEALINHKALVPLQGNSTQLEVDHVGRESTDE